MDKQYTLKQDLVFSVFLAIIPIVIVYILAARHTFSPGNLKACLIVGDFILCVAIANIVGHRIPDPDINDPMMTHKTTLSGIGPLFFGAIIAAIDFAIGYAIIF